MASLATLLADKIKAAGLNNTAAAEAIGVSMPSFRGVISGKAIPNKRSIERYAKFLGISVEEIAGSKAEKKAKGKPGRPKGTGKPGRPKGSKNVGKPGRPKGSKAVSKNQPAGISVADALNQIVSVLEAAEELLSDELAIAVHNLDKRSREKIQILFG